MTKIYVIGAGGHAKVVIDIIESCGIGINAIIDTKGKSASLYGYPIYNEYPTDVAFSIIAIGDNKTRKKIADEFAFSPISVIHPSSIISKYASVGIGTVIMPGVILNANVAVGNHCIINTNSSVDHDCSIEDFVHISPNASIAGNVHVGECTHIGIGVCVIPGIKIGKNCTIGAGAVIIKDIPDNCTVVGNPGRVIKNNCREEIK